MGDESDTAGRVMGPLAGVMNLEPWYPTSIERPSPEHGPRTDEVLTGFGVAEIGSLRASTVITNRQRA